MLTSWRTTALGVAGAICVAAAFVYTALGGDPAALDLSGAGMPEWLRVLGEMLLALGLVASRDHQVSSANIAAAKFTRGPGGGQ